MPLTVFSHVGLLIFSILVENDINRKSSFLQILAYASAASRSWLHNRPMQASALAFQIPMSLRRWLA